MTHMIDTGHRSVDQSQSTSSYSGVEQEERDLLLLSLNFSPVYISRILGIHFTNTLVLYFLLKREITRQK